MNGVDYNHKKNDMGLKEAIVIALQANKEWRLIGSMSLVQIHKWY
jgi:hypothetical protein